MNQSKEWGQKKKKKKMQFLEADPGNTIQSEGIERHVDSLQKSTTLWSAPAPHPTSVNG